MKTRLLLLLALAAISVVVSACGATFGKTISDTEQVSADGVTMLEVENDNGEVTVRALQTDENVVSVNYQLRNADDIEFSVTREGDRVIVRAKDRSGPLESAIANLTIRLPAQIALDIRTGNGDIEVTEIQSPITASTGNGTVSLDRTGIAGSQSSLSTGNGRVEVDTHLGDLTITTGNGSVEIAGHDGRIASTSGNGRISYEGTIAAGQQNRLVTGNGDVSATFTNADVSFDAETGNGRVTVNADYTTSGTPSNDHVIGVIGSESGAASLEIKTGNGDVTLSQVEPD